jgi:hypothetical protein
VAVLAGVQLVQGASASSCATLHVLQERLQVTIDEALMHGVGCDARAPSSWASGCAGVISASSSARTAAPSRGRDVGEIAETLEGCGFAYLRTDSVDQAIAWLKDAGIYGAVRARTNCRIVLDGWIGNRSIA